MDTKNKSREMSLMENMCHLTIDLFKKLVDDEKIGFFGGDDVIEELTRLSYKFEDEYYDPDEGTFLDQIEMFEKEYLGKRIKMANEMPKVDMWLDHNIEIGSLLVNHIYTGNDLSDSYVELSKGERDNEIWFLNEISSSELEILYDFLTNNKDNHEQG